MLTQKIQDRVNQLVKEGYLLPVRFGHCLTDKGLTVLLSCADSPLQVGSLVKPSLIAERFWAADNQARKQGEQS